MLDRVLRRIENLVIAQPRRVVGVAALVSLGALALGAGIELRTSRSELVAKDDPEQLRWERLREEFAGPDPLIVALEPAAGRPVGLDVLQEAADVLGAALEARPEVDYVFYHLEMDWLLENAVHLAPPAQLRRAIDQLEGLLADGTDSIVLGGLADLNDRVSAQIERALASGAVMPLSGASDEAARLSALLRAEHEFLEDPDDFVARHSGLLLQLARPPRDSSITPDGYLSTRDQKLLLLLVSPTDADAELAKQRRLVEIVRATADRVLQGLPVAYGLTGSPAMNVEEMASIRHDSQVTSGIAIAGVGLLAMLAFRRRRHALLGLIVLAMGVAWSIGAVRLEVGYLNMITTAMVPILVGIGIDFAVHPISQYEIERHDSRDRRKAVQAAFRKTSGAVVVSALTTSAAFFCFSFMQFRGFSELGVVAGGGVLLCLLAALFVLPALLLLHGDVASNRMAPVDRFWLPASGLLLRHPRVVTAAAIAITVVAAWAGRSVPLSTSLLDLLPPGAESLRYLEIVSDESATSVYVNIVVSDDLEQMREFERRARGSEVIARFESVLDFLPESTETTRAAVARVGEFLDRVSVTDAPWSGRSALAGSIERLERALEDAVEAAFVTGLSELVGPLEAARLEAEHAHALVSDASKTADVAWARGEQTMRERLRALIDQIRASAAAAPPSIDTLPRHLRTRFLTDRGRYLGFIHPANSIFDRPALGRFNNASFEVSANAIGFPVLFAAHSRQITSGFGLTLAAGSLLVLLILGLDLRSVLHMALALVPVGVGIAWMLGLMRAFGLSFNLANLVAVPLVLGVGIDNGVHMIHRYRLEGNAGMTVVLSHTGRAILVASLTTMVGFGSLSLASHRGMASLGVLLVLGVGASMVAALVVLPNLLVAFGWARRH